MAGVKRSSPNGHKWMHIYLHDFFFLPCALKHIFRNNGMKIYIIKTRVISVEAFLTLKPASGPGRRSCFPMDNGTRLKTVFEETIMKHVSAEKGHLERSLQILQVQLWLALSPPSPPFTHRLMNDVEAINQHQVPRAPPALECHWWADGVFGKKWPGTKMSR